MECINDESTVLVNGVPRNRARLSNGDQIKIGIVELKVDMPEKVEKRSFSISFADDDSPEGVGSIAGEILPSTEAIEEVDTPLERASEDKEDAFEIGNFFEADDDEDTAEIFGDGDESDLDLMEHAPDIPMSTPEDEIKNTQPEPRSRPDRKAVFEFDSVDSEDTPFTDEDLAAVENRAGNMSVENADFFSAELAFANVSEDEAESPNAGVDAGYGFENSDAESRIPGGSSQGGKFWRWIGSTVVPAIEVLEHSDEKLVCYRVSEHTELSQCSFKNVRESVASRSEDSIFLISENDPMDVTRFLIAKRWNERMRHPEALSMSISILPARHVGALFEQVDAIVLVQKGDFSLLRINAS